MFSRMAITLLSLAWICQSVVQGQTSSDPVPPTPLNPAVLAAPVKVLEPIEKLQRFDEQAVEIRWGPSGWQLWSGTVFLKDFARKEEDARTALHLVRELHLNARGRLGAPQAVAEYWLSNGRPPTAAPQGFRTLAFDPTTLSVVQVEGQWMLRELKRVLLSFGNNEAEARRALAVFERHHFDRVCFIGEPTPSFMYFLSSAEEHEKQFVAEDGSTSPESSTHSTKAVHIVKTGANPADPKRSAIDPKVGSPLLPPGRQLLQVTNIPGQVNLPDRIPFGWQHAQLRQVGDTWELGAQDVTLARFGLDEAGARQALTLLRHYHFTELCLVGGDDPCFSYLLVNGRMPRELRFGISNIEFHPERAQVRRTGADYVVEADGICIHNFGQREDAARSLCELIRQNNPDHLCWVGANPQQGMVFFVRRTLAPFNSGNDAQRKP